MKCPACNENLTSFRHNNHCRMCVYCPKCTYNFTHRKYMKNVHHIPSIYVCAPKEFTWGRGMTRESRRKEIETEEIV